MKTALVAVMVAAGAAAGSSARGAAPDSGRHAWLHVRVEEPGKSSKVHVNLPMTVVEAALKAAPETIASHGKIHLGPTGRHMTVAELREVWKELRAAGDMDMVTVEEQDGRVTVAKRGDMVQVRVDKGEQVRVDVPVAVVDALLATPGDELNIQAGLAELRKMRGEIVSVRDKDTTVRVWIDESAPAQGGK